jgi:hypothetical protein
MNGGEAMVEGKKVRQPSAHIRAFGVEIEEIMCRHECDVLDALVTYQERTGVEMEDMARWLRKLPELKGKLHDECARKGLVNEKRRRRRPSTRDEALKEMKTLLSG